MEEKKLCFGQQNNITLSGQDGTVIQFPFTMVDSVLVGSPEESRKTTSHRIEVAISRTLRETWGFDEDDNSLVLILFEIGRRELIERLRRNGHVSELELVNVPQENVCPFDSARIPNPDGFEMSVEIPSRIGF